MRIAKLFTAAATSVALMASPAVAASQAPAKSVSAMNVDSRVGAMSDADEELFRGRGRGGALVFILVAVVIAIGIFIVVDDEDGEDPVSA